MSKSGGSGGPSQAFYDTMMDLSKQSQALGDIYNSIDLSGYRPGDAAHDLTDQYYKTGSYSTDSSSTDMTSTAYTSSGDRVVKNGYGNFTITSDGRVIDQQGDDVTETGMGQSMLNNNRIDTPHDGKSVTSKSELGAAGLIPSITGGDDPVVGRSFTSKSGLGAAGLIPSITGGDDSANDPIRPSTSGKPYKGTDGKYYIYINGQTYDASSQGLNQLVTDTSFGLVKPTADLASETIQSQRDVLPSSTTSQISANNLLTAQNSATQGLVGDKTASEKAGYNYLTSRYNTDTNLEADREASTRLDYGAKNSLNQSTINQGDSRDSAAISGNYLTTDQNEAARRLVGDTETATRSGLKYQTAQNDSNTRLVPYNENASIADLQYKTDYSKGAAALLPKRFEATGKYIDESMKGIDVNTAMDEAGVDAARAFSNSQAAARRAAARSGVVANDSMFGSGAIAAAKASIGARALAKKNAQDENYKRLGAVALG